MNPQPKMGSQNPIKVNITKETPLFVVPEKELDITFSRSGGKGGQNVNKLSTRAQLQWIIDDSNAFTHEEKLKIKHFFKKHLAGKITEEGVIFMEAQEERSQLQNKELVMRKLNLHVNEAFAPVKEWIPTKPTKGSVEKRLQKKELHSKNKRQRGAKIKHDDW